MSARRMIQLSSFERKRAEEAVGYMADHLGEPLVLRKVAAAVGLSSLKLKAGLWQLFRKSHKAFLQDLRMEKARVLLLETNDLITAVARQCGYRNDAAFHRAFKKRFGQTPDEYRKR